MSNRIPWDEAFIRHAFVAAMRSPDPSTQLGAVIVAPDNRVVASGYNGMPRGVDLSEERDYRLQGTRKYRWMAHAERNALDNALRAGLSVGGCRVFGLIPPCVDCARGMCQAGIKEFLYYLPTAQWYYDNSNSDWFSAESFKDMLLMLRLAGVKFNWTSSIDRLGQHRHPEFEIMLAGKKFKHEHVSSTHFTGIVADRLEAALAENDFFMIFQKLFEDSEYRIRSKPREFSNVYKAVTLDEITLSEIYDPDEEYSHGLIPDYAIDNTKTGKTIYVEVKRQDGWVEGKTRSAGRGNAHERSNKLFTPGLTDLMRTQGKIAEPALPFWVIFQGDIARDPKRVREVTFWYKGHSDHFFFWRKNSEPGPLISHFKERIMPLLD